jgi:SAM-dependent methyltransferase
MTTPPEKWASDDVYEHFMGRWSREVAPLFLRWLQPDLDSAWLDVGCGTGALTSAISLHGQVKRVVGIDPSFDFLLYAGHRNQTAKFASASALALPFADGLFDFVVSGLVLNFVPDPALALSEFVRIAKPNGGVVAAYVWDYAGKMEFLRYFWDVASALDSSAKLLHQGNRFPLCDPQLLTRLWQDSGLCDVSVYPLDVLTVFDDFDQYWQPFTSGDFPAPRYALSVSPEQREALRERLRQTIPVADDGSVRLVARAWAIRGSTCRRP